MKTAAITRCGIVSLSVAVCGSARGQDLLATFGAAPPGALRVDVPSGATSVVGELTLGGFPVGGTIADLASGPGGGVIYGVGIQGGQSNLYSVNPWTGALGFAGPITLAGFGLPEAGAGALARDA